MNESSFLFLFFLGAMTVTRELYPMGFYVVMIAKTNDYKCQTQMKINGLRHDAFPVIFNRVKEVELTIVREITKDEYAIGELIYLVQNFTTRWQSSKSQLILCIF